MAVHLMLPFEQSYLGLEKEISLYSLIPPSERLFSICTYYAFIEYGTMLFLKVELHQYYEW